ncbi:MAG: hypothetical protein S4CHLAM81_02410 [Chlamydiales bacterium]|nr:hypothetical protein [Chlamydiales bacterium]MCH9635033.1 hypothetical protein [Chlamydiales bacterium]
MAEAVQRDFTQSYKKPIIVVSALVSLAASILALRFGAPSAWQHSVSYAKTHPALIATSAVMVSVVAICALAIKRGENREIATMLALAALFALTTFVLKMEAPSRLKYMLNNPQLIAMPLAAYGVVRLTHHLVTKKSKEIKGDAQTKKQAITNAVAQRKGNRLGYEPFTSQEQADFEFHTWREKQGPSDYRAKAGLVAAVALLAIGGLGMLGWHGLWGKASHFVQQHQGEFIAAGALGLIATSFFSLLFWAQSRPEPTVVHQLAEPDSQ